MRAQGRSYGQHDAEADFAPYRAPHGPLLVIAPHPDDETLGAGGLIRAATLAGRDVWIVVVTCGDAMPWGAHRLRAWRSGWRDGWTSAQRALGEARMGETRRAAARLGVPPERVLFLGFPDRGMVCLAAEHFGTPYRSPATGADVVPYAGAYRPGAPYTGEAFVDQLHEIVARVRPAEILTPGPFDSHADHRGTTDLVARVWHDLEDVRRLFYLVHSDLAWPFPKGLHPGRLLRPPAAYPRAGWHSHALDARELRAKREAIHAYDSQLGVMAWNLWSFLRRNELLLPAEVLARVRRR